MTLRVPFEEFAAAVARLLSTSEAYVTPTGEGTLVTAADPSRNILLRVSAETDPESVRARLEEQGILVFAGAWEEESPLCVPESPCEPVAEAAEESAPPPSFVAVVAYKSDEESPGAWVDAYPYRPTETQVLNAMHQELTENGEIAEVSFEEFVRLSKANVVVIEPEAVQAFVRRHTTV
ncbi:MAG: hypothetical protein KIS66_15805 [Fimbriimonadaceae bacterium]|nr:hypothetical protein [Fimbriimonadaceae bacterium]